MRASVLRAVQSLLSKHPSPPVTGSDSPGPPRNAILFSRLIS
jgi:hypothetical protein